MSLQGRSHPLSDGGAGEWLELERTSLTSMSEMADLKAHDQLTSWRLRYSSPAWCSRTKASVTAAEEPWNGLSVHA